MCSLLFVSPFLVHPTHPQFFFCYKRCFIYAWILYLLPQMMYGDLWPDGLSSCSAKFISSIEPNFLDIFDRTVSRSWDASISLGSPDYDREWDPRGSPSQRIRVCSPTQDRSATPSSGRSLLMFSSKEQYYVHNKPRVTMHQIRNIDCSWNDGHFSRGDFV